MRRLNPFVKLIWLSCSTLICLFVSTPAWSDGVITTDTFLYTDPASGGQVDLVETHSRSGTVDTWDYMINNVSYDPMPGTSNGLSGFTITFPQPVPELSGIFNPAGWLVNCCAGSFGAPPDGVEWDIRNDLGLGIMPGFTGDFGFTTGNRVDLVWDRGFMTTPGGWTHTWENGVQANIFTDGSISGPGPAVPEPASLLLLSTGLLGAAGLRWRRIFNARRGAWRKGRKR